MRIAFRSLVWGPSNLEHFTRPRLYQTNVLADVGTFVSIADALPPHRPVHLNRFLDSSSEIESTANESRRNLVGSFAVAIIAL
jgi:hypothetical protein